jgi:hypothetical protein
MKIFFLLKNNALFCTLVLFIYFNIQLRNVLINKSINPINQSINQPIYLLIYLSIASIHPSIHQLTPVHFYVSGPTCLSGENCRQRATETNNTSQQHQQQQHSIAL